MSSAVKSPPAAPEKQAEYSQQFLSRLGDLLAAEEVTGNALVTVRDGGGSNEARLLAYFLARQHRQRGQILLKLKKLTGLDAEGEAGRAGSGGEPALTAAASGGSQLLDSALNYQRNLERMFGELLDLTGSRTARKHLRDLTALTGKDHAALRELSRQKYF